MAKENKIAATALTYDEAMQRAEQLVQELEQTQAISVQQYKEKAQEVQRLLSICKQHLTGLKDELAK